MTRGKCGHFVGLGKDPDRECVPCMAESFRRHLEQADTAHATAEAICLVGEALERVLPPGWLFMVVVKGPDNPMASASSNMEAQNAVIVLRHLASQIESAFTPKGGPH